GPDTPLTGGTGRSLRASGETPTQTPAELCGDHQAPSISSTTQTGHFSFINHSSFTMGKVEGGIKCVKYVLFIFNFIFWIMGSLVLAVGLWLRLDSNTVSLIGEGGPDTFFIGVYILIAVGALVMLFFACLLVIFGSEVAAGVFGFLNKDKIIDEIKHFYDDSVENDDNNNTMARSYQIILNCCGSSSVKPTFCENTSTNQTCDVAIEDFFNSKLFIVGYVGIGIAGVMIIGMIFSMVLCCAVRNSREVI
ncbi:hypothetical protein DNTS_023658, partial [Danionella cerebrum]